MMLLNLTNDPSIVVDQVSDRPIGPWTRDDVHGVSQCL